MSNIYYAHLNIHGENLTEIKSWFPSFYLMFFIHFQNWTAKSNNAQPHGNLQTLTLLSKSLMYNFNDLKVSKGSSLTPQAHFPAGEINFGTSFSFNLTYYSCVCVGIKVAIILD